MRLLDAHRRKQALEAEEARLLELAAEQAARHEAMRLERRAIAEALAKAINRGDVEIDTMAQANVLANTCRGPLGGESERFYINMGDDRTYIVNVYAHGVMSPT